MNELKVFTSASAHKMLRQLDREKDLLDSDEMYGLAYIEAEGETPLVPAYDYTDVSQKISDINSRIRRIKHGINLLNTSTKLNNFDMTIDEALVYMAQLNNRLSTLAMMRRKQPKRRKGVNQDGVVEYEVVNYDIDRVRKDYEDITEIIAALQLDIDYINQTATFTITW